MLPQFFLKTKLLPPRLGRHILPRPRLVDRMRGFLDQPATIVYADAGCGKTTLVTEFVRASGLPYVWYQIDPTDVDLAVFFGYVVYGIRSLHTEFGQVVLRFISETENLSSKIDQLVDVFVNEVGEQIEQKTIVVLDDYHNVDSSEPIAASIDRLVRYLPDVLHIVITSRSMPNLSVTRLRSKGLIGVLDRKDLLFTPGEVQKLFAETFHQSLAPDQVNQFYEKTDGWVTGLQLIQQSLDHATEHNGKAAAGTDSSRERLAAAFQQSELDIFAYFAEEVLDSETSETRLMLGKISLLERIDGPICEAALGIRDCADQLRALARRNVFISQTYASGSEEEYRLHPLFRSFLNRWLASYLGADEIRLLHKECAAYFARSARWDLVVNHLAEAGASSDVAELLAEHGSELVESGRLETIKRTFDQLEEGSLEGRPRALIARADVALIESDHGRALALYAQAARMARMSEDPGVEAAALRGQAYIARYGNDFDLAVKLATSAIELAPGLHALRARCYNTIGLCCFTSAGGAERAIENWQAALAEAREAGDDRFARIVMHNLGLPYSMEGDLNEAVHWLSQMIDGRTSAVNPGQSDADHVPFPQEAIAHLNIARVKIVQGKLDEAESHLGVALHRCQLFNLKSTAAEALETFGNLYRERGDYSRALEFYDEAARGYRDAGVLLTDRELLDEKATLYLRMGDPRSAEQEATEYFRARSSGSPSDRSSALITWGRIQMAAGRTAEAETMLTEAATLAGENRLGYNEVRATLSLALLLWDMAKTPEALAQFGRAVELAVRYDYSYQLSSAAAASPELFRAAIKAGIAPDYLARIVPKEAFEVAAAAVTGGGGLFSAATIVQTVIERPAYDLAINMLGPVEIFRDPTGLEKEAWRLSKALHILCYLCSRRNHRAPKETLVDLFWSDAEADTVAKNFHPTISHMRKALNTGQVVKKDFVQYREGAYLLNPQYRYRLDTEEFERLLAEAREARRTGSSDGAAALLAQAIKVYRGDFLEEFYYNWIEELQSYYRDLYLDALKELIAHYCERNEHELVIRYGQMFLARDPYQEDVHCNVMEAHVQSGNRAAAIEQFDGLRKMLRRELGVDPLPATIARYEALIK
jgi:ATP/maltotriose-dependent transcriptional regulator MalT/DNA-binding SARP family transcriptional activator